MVLRDVSMLLPALCGVPWQGPTASKRTLRLPERRKAQETTTSDVEVYENKALLASPIGISGCSRQRRNTSFRSANAERSEKVSSREAALGGALHSAMTSPPGTQRFSRPADFHLCESGGGAALRGPEKGERLPCCCLCLAPLWPSELFIFSCCQFLLLCHHLLNLNLNLILTPSGLNYPLSTVGTVTWAHKTALISSKIRKRTFRTKKMF